MALRSEAAERTEVERERVEVGLVRLGVLDMDDTGSSAKSPREAFVGATSLVAASIRLAEKLTAEME